MTITSQMDRKIRIWIGKHDMDQRYAIYKVMLVLNLILEITGSMEKVLLYNA